MIPAKLSQGEQERAFVLLVKAAIEVSEEFNAVMGSADAVWINRCDVLVEKLEELDRATGGYCDAISWDEEGKG